MASIAVDEVCSLIFGFISSHLLVDEMIITIPKVVGE
jgi:hypothetical protein